MRCEEPLRYVHVVLRRLVKNRCGLTAKDVQLTPDDFDAEIAQLARVRATQRDLANHRMAWLSSARGLDLHAHDRKPWPHVVEVAVRVLVGHAGNCTERIGCRRLRTELRIVDLL